jgi:hypothetical protein
MLVFFVILLSVLLTASIIGIILLWKAGERQLFINDVLNENVVKYESWISDWRAQVLRTWAHMKMLDDKQMFEKDDDVGVVFQEMKTIIQSLNDRIQEETTEEGE